ncbi:MAG: hypothetical protein LUG51_07960 [Tannerellaceae bacterium]|nr:hypothetical protein [Tannerellaceae bacterium]
MNKLTCIRLGESTNLIFNNAALWIKQYFDDNAQDIVSNATGTTGLILKILSKPFIDRYFDQLSQEKLANLGSATYLKAAYNQASKSMEKLEDQIKSNHTPEEIIRVFEETTVSSYKNIDKNNLFLVFQPVYHPIILTVKENYIHILEKLNIETAAISTFKQDFNTNIEEEIKNTFGEDYQTHIEEI